MFKLTNDVYERDFVSSLTVGKADGLFFGECAVRGAAGVLACRLGRCFYGCVVKVAPGVLACRLGRCFYGYAVKVAPGDPHPAPLAL